MSDSSTMPVSPDVTRPASPMARYRADLEREDFHRDPAQEQAVHHLQRLYEALLARPRVSRRSATTGKRIKSRMAGFLGRREERQAPALPDINGLYLWGGVGRGKTYLMDCFHESLPFSDKMRTHFHRFMQRVHNELEHYKGEHNPLKLVAAKFAAEARVICFDEFFVKDITDAMILTNLLEALFEHDVVLVATSNVIPDDLYKEGLQRSRFLPAIELLKRHCDIVNVDAGIDYRLRALERAEIFHAPLDAEAERELARSFREIAGHEGEEGATLEINHRVLHTRCLHDDVVWFEFRELCDGPRSQNDYIELAREFHSVLLSNVTCMNRKTEDQARRFINMVDVFYDRGVKLLMSAEAPAEQLYSDGRLEFEFKRTLSRLQEMQSHEYLALPHKP